MGGNNFTITSAVVNLKPAWKTAGPIRCCTCPYPQWTRDSGPGSLSPTKNDEVIVKQPIQWYKHGCSTNTVLILFINETNPQSGKNARCKDCNTMTNHHKKRKPSMMQWNKCPKFCISEVMTDFQRLPMLYAKMMAPKSSRQMSSHTYQNSSSFMVHQRLIMEGIWRENCEFEGNHVLISGRWCAMHVHQWNSSVDILPAVYTICHCANKCDGTGHNVHTHNVAQGQEYHCASKNNPW